MDPIFRDIHLAVLTCQDNAALNHELWVIAQRLVLVALMRSGFCPTPELVQAHSTQYMSKLWGIAQQEQRLLEEAFIGLEEQ